MMNLDLCFWKYMSNQSKVQYTEGRLRHCQMYCDGLQFRCNSYEPLSVLPMKEELKIPGIPAKDIPPPLSGLEGINWDLIGKKVKG